MERLQAERMFVKVVETGSFAAAARRLGTSSGQASKLVSKLEADLGVKLLNRTTRALSLTEAGQAYADRMRAILESFDDLTTEVQNAAIAPRGRIRLTAPLSFGTVRLAPVLARFAAEYPEISLEVHFNDRIVNLVEEGFDAAVRVGRAMDGALVGRRLGSARMITVAGPRYLTLRGRPVIPADLARHDCILDLNNRDGWQWSYRDDTRVTVSGRLIFSNASACLAAVEEGLGIAQMPDFVATEALAAGRAVEVLADWSDIQLGIHALWPGRRHLPRKLRVLVDFMAAEMR
jgi:DNA-binding transcriptional LysR family regulator